MAWREAMDAGRRAAWLVMFTGGMLAAAGCSDKPRSLVSQAIGTAGGKISLTDGTAIEVPEGALAAETIITIASNRAPEGAVGPAYRFGPSGLRFQKPVTVVLPVDPAQVAAGAKVRVLTAADDSDVFEALPNAQARDATHLAATTLHFSVYVASSGTTAPRTLSSGENFPGAMLLDSGTVYYVNQGSATNPAGSGKGFVASVGIDGCCLSTLTPALSDPRALALVSHTLYVALGGWPDPATGLTGAAIVAVSADGGTPETRFTDVGFPVALASDGTSLYWLDSDRGTLAKGDLAGGAVTVLSSGHKRPRGLAVSGGNAYFSAMDDGTIVSVPLAGGAATTLAQGQSKPTTVAVDGGYVYWLGTGDGTVRRAPIGGGATETLASGLDRPSGLAVSGGTVTYGVIGEGTIRSYAAGKSTVLAKNQNIPFSLGRDGSGLAWTANGNNVNEGAVFFLP